MLRRLRVEKIVFAAWADWPIGTAVATLPPAFVPVVRLIDAVNDAFDGNAAAPRHDTRIAEMLQSAVAVVVPHRIGVGASGHRTALRDSGRRVEHADLIHSTDSHTTPVLLSRCR